MKLGRVILSIAVAAILPGALAYGVVRLVSQTPTTYTVVPPPTKPATTERIIHRADVPANPEGRSGENNPDAPRREMSGEAPSRPEAARATDTSRPERPARERPQGENRQPGAHPNVARPSAPPAGGQTGSAPSRPTMSDDQRATFGLLRLFRGLERLEEGAHPLTPKQATAILAAMQPLRAATAVTGAQAARAQQRLDAELTAEQRAELANAPRSGRGEGPGGTRGGERPPGDGPGLGNMSDGNPFNPTSNHPMAQRLAAVYDALEAKARQDR